MAQPVINSSAVKAQPSRTVPLTIEEVPARIELTHPLLRATGVERAQAREKILKALDASEPKLKEETLVARYQPSISRTFLFTIGQEDSMIPMVGSAILFGGIRNGLGDRVNQNNIAFVTDQNLFYPRHQMVIGGAIHCRKHSSPPSRIELSSINCLYSFGKMEAR